MTFVENVPLLIMVSDRAMESLVTTSCMGYLYEETKISDLCWDFSHRGKLERQNTL